MRDINDCRNRRVCPAVVSTTVIAPGTNLQKRGMDHNKAFGLVMKDARLRLLLSQESLAFKVGLDRSYISLLERGKRSASLNTLYVLAAAFKLTPSQLVQQCEDMQKNG